MVQTPLTPDDNLTVLWLEFAGAATPLPKAHAALGHDIAMLLLTRSAVQHVVCKGPHTILSGFLHPLPALHCAWGIRDFLCRVGVPICTGIHSGTVTFDPDPCFPGCCPIAGTGVQEAQSMAQLAKVSEILVTPALYAHPAVTPDKFVFLHQQRWLDKAHDSAAMALSCYVLALHGALPGVHHTTSLCACFPPGTYASTCT